MVRNLFVCLLLGGVCPLFAQTDLLHQGSEKPKQLLLGLYASLYNMGHELPPYHHFSFQAIESVELDTDRLTDSLIYLNRRFGKNYNGTAASISLPELLEQGEIPNYQSRQVIEHITQLYQWRNSNNPIFAMTVADPALYASFLTIADKVDGSFDSRLELPNLKAFYELLVTGQVPLPAICYNCREEEGWLDRRKMIRTEKLEKELPKSLTKFHKDRIDDERKLDAITAFIVKNIRSSTDGWQTDYWQTPMETLLVEEGDCEDFAILFCSIATLFGIETHVAVGSLTLINENGKRETLGHAWIYYQGRVIDPILVNHRGPVHYQPQFQFNQRDAMLIREATPTFQDRVASRD